MFRQLDWIDCRRVRVHWTVQSVALHTTSMCRPRMSRVDRVIRWCLQQLSDGEVLMSRDIWFQKRYLEWCGRELFTFSLPVTLTFDLLTSNPLPSYSSPVISPPNLKFIRLSDFEQIVGTGQTDGRTGVWTDGQGATIYVSPRRVRIGLIIQHNGR